MASIKSDPTKTEDVPSGLASRASDTKSTAALFRSGSLQNPAGKTKRPPDTDFRQQRLPAWRPILTPYNVIPILIGLGIIFIPMGIIFLMTSGGVQEYTMDYTACMVKAGPEWTTAPSGTFEWRKVARPDDLLPASYAKEVCQLRFKVAKAMDGPVLQYYRLSNYYQNQRLYVRSVNWDQLRGAALPADQLGDCSPLVSPSDSTSSVYYPCGLIANSMFSDQYSDMVSEDGRSYAFPPKGIAWPSDKNRYGTTKYTLEQVKPPPFWTTNAELVTPEGTYKTLPDLAADERFQVWMRVAGLPTFRKPYGKHQGSIPAGTYTITIDSNFEVASYGATKALVFSTTSWMGGKNPFLGIVYIVTGTVFLAFAAFFLVKHLMSPRPLGDISYLSWFRGSPSV